jgi:hypothetical protein
MRVAHALGGAVARPVVDEHSSCVSPRVSATAEARLQLVGTIGLVEDGNEDRQIGTVPPAAVPMRSSRCVGSDAEESDRSRES